MMIGRADLKIRSKFEAVYAEEFVRGRAVGSFSL